MARRLPLRRAPEAVDAVRRRLGGRAATEPCAGELVSLATGPGMVRTGVVLYASGDVIDVWLHDAILGGIVRRTRRDKASPFHGAVPRELATVAADARCFGALREGQRVRFQPEGESATEATLVEKCRFGAILARDDGTVVGVGFRRLAAVPDSPDRNAN